MGILTMSISLAAVLLVIGLVLMIMSAKKKTFMERFKELELERAEEDKKAQNEAFNTFDGIFIENLKRASVHDIFSDLCYAVYPAEDSLVNYMNLELELLFRQSELRLTAREARMVDSYFLSPENFELP